MRCIKPVSLNCLIFGRSRLLKISFLTIVVFQLGSCIQGKMIQREFH